MRHRILLGALSLAMVGFCAFHLVAQDPQPQSTDSVAKPKKPAADETRRPPTKHPFLPNSKSLRTQPPPAMFRRTGPPPTR